MREPGWRRFALLTLILLYPTLSAVGQGKIAGRITDAETGESLPGANVLISDTQYGTVSDVDGNYVLLNVRPGQYSVVFSYVGYEAQRVEGIRVTTGQTSRYDIRLRPQTVMGGEVIVQAERPLVQKDLTASKKTVVAEDIELMPVESFFGVLTTQAGINQGADGALHIRGGRSNEIAYMVDGLSVANPFSTNGLATDVATNAIQELTVVSGAFNAEYGQAMSGIVNIVTKEGGNSLDGSFSLTAADRFSGNDEIWMAPSGVDVNTTTLEGSLGGPIPLGDNLTFFVSGRRDASDGYIYGVREHLPSDSANFNTGYYEIHGRPWWEYECPELPFECGDAKTPDEVVPLNPRKSYSLTGKLTYRPDPTMKLSYSYLQDGLKRTPFGSSQFKFRYNPDGLSQRREVSRNHALHWTHTVNPTTFYTVRLSFATSSFESFLYEDPTDPRYVKDQGDTDEGNVIGFPGNNFLFGGNEKQHIYEDSRSFRGKADLTHQFGAIHEAKVGVDWRIHSLDRENFDVLFDGNVYREPTIPDLDSPDHDRYTDQTVVETSAYAQDKLEFDDFIINVGIRYDRFDPNGQYVADLLDPFEDRLERSIRDTSATAKNMLSPRLGVSFPITDRGIIHFSYGHFYQMPTLRNLYLNPEFEFGVGDVPTFGNADLRPQRTVLYEIGLQQQLTENLAFDITGYFKDIRDYLALQRIRFGTIPGEDELRVYNNKDYANVKGVTVAITKRRSRNGLLSATVDYTFQIAEGNNDASDAFFFNYLSGRENEFELVPLDFDQRHIVSSTVSLTRPNNWGLSFIGQIASGYPYSPLIFDQNLDLLPNSGRKPSQIKLDARVFKHFSVGQVRFTAFFKVFNLLDRLNERFVFNDTGRSGYTLNTGNVHAAWEGAYGLPGIHTLDEWNARPHYYSAPREIRLGLTLDI